MFPLRFVRIPSIFRANLQIRKHSVAAPIAQNSENELKNVSDEVQYPPILDLSFRSQQRRKTDAFREFVKRQETVEEKLIAVNMPRYYGWLNILMKENEIHYNTLEQTQFLTRTHILPEAGLPSFYDNLISPETLDQIVGNVRSQVEDVLILEYNKRNRQRELAPDVLSDPEKLQNVQSKAVTRQINRILLVELSSKFPHLLETQIDYDPRVEAFWAVGGIDPPSTVKTSKRRIKWQKPYIEDPVDRHFQYIGEPSLQLRHALPLREIVPYQESENPQYTVPEFRYDPRVAGYHRGLRHGTNIPGFWPGDEQEFGLLSYHNCGYMATRHRDYDDEEVALKTHAMRASFAWLHSQACYQGFSTYNDITYPLVTQNIISSGQWWLFSIYQLNTMLLCDHHIDDNPKKNLFWTTRSMQLFEKIEDNRVHGLNDEVLKNLIKLYVNEPQKRAVEMKPYLGENVKVVADIKDVAKRSWLERTFKNIMSCRPRHRLMPEVYNWQEIYIRKCKTRPMEKVMEPWQRGINVQLRKLDDHTPKYIPKCYRPYPKSRAKWEKTFYPK